MGGQARERTDGVSFVRLHFLPVHFSHRALAYTGQYVDMKYKIKIEISSMDNNKRQARITSASTCKKNIVRDK
jgi:hypothetical protein